MPVEGGGGGGYVGGSWHEPGGGGVQNTVRWRIIKAVRDAIAALANVGYVGEPASADGITGAAFAKDGKCAVDMICGHDQAAAVFESEANLAQDELVFDIELVITLPVPLPLDGGGLPRSPSDVAADFSSEVYDLYTSTDPTQSPHTWGGLARDTQYLGGGAAEFGYDEQGNVVLVFTKHAMRIRYAHKLGDPTVAV